MGSIVYNMNNYGGSHMFSKLEYPELKNTHAKFEKGELYGALLTFPTAEMASSFLKLTSGEYYKDYIDKINDTTFYLSLEFASFLYCYPGADFSNLDELNCYTGYKKQDKIQQSLPEKQPIIEIPKDIPKNSNPINISKADQTLFSFSPKYDADKLKFKREVYYPDDFYTDAECAKFVGKDKLTKEDEFTLIGHSNCTAFPTLAFYLEKKHGCSDAIKAINRLDNESEGTLKTLTPQEVMDFIEKELEVKNKI